MLALLALTSAANDVSLSTSAQTAERTRADRGLSAADPAARARAACDLRELGDAAADAIQPLVAMLGDAAPVEAMVCDRSGGAATPNDLTTPGEQAAAALVAIGTRAFDPVLSTLRSTAWAARRNAAWALGAFDDQRAVAALIDALKDREPAVREQVGVGARRARRQARRARAHRGAEGYATPRVRRQAAWALGAIDDAARGRSRCQPALER